MTNGAQATTNGKTLEQLFQVSKVSLKAQLDSADMLKSVRDDKHEFSKWMEETHWGGLSDELATHLTKYLQASLVGIFAGAWCKFAELRKRAQETSQDGTATSNVGLADHQFTYDVKPCLDIELNGTKVTEVPFKIAAHFHVSGLELGLHKGCIHHVRTGKCEFSGALSLAEKELWRSPTATLDLPGEFHLMQPIRLVAEEVKEEGHKVSRRIAGIVKNRA
jgi:hypothetical protein